MRNACVALGLFAMVSACAIGPDYVRPATEVPGSFKEMKDWKQAQPVDAIAKGEWWKIFGDTRLNELEEQVNISNQTIIAAEAQYRQAAALLQAARAAYFPSLGGGASYTRELKSATLATSSSTGSVPTSDYLLPLNLSWEIDLWGRIRRTVEASRSGAQASAADLESARLSAHAALAQSYFQLRTVDNQTKLFAATVEAYRKSFELTQNRYNSGVAGKSDVLQAQTQLKSTESQLIDLGIQRAQLEHAIALLIGKPAASFSLSVEDFKPVPPGIPAGMPSELLERRT